MPPGEAGAGLAAMAMSADGPPHLPAVRHGRCCLAEGLIAADAAGIAGSGPRAAAAGGCRPRRGRARAWRRPVRPRHGRRWRRLPRNPAPVHPASPRRSVVRAGRARAENAAPGLRGAGKGFRGPHGRLHALPGWAAPGRQRIFGSLVHARVVPVSEAGGPRPAAHPPRCGGQDRHAGLRGRLGLPGVRHGPESLPGVFTLGGCPRLGQLPDQHNGLLADSSPACWPAWSPTPASPVHGLRPGLAVTARPGRACWCSWSWVGPCRARGRWPQRSSEAVRPAGGGAARPFRQEGGWVPGRGGAQPSQTAAPRARSSRAALAYRRGRCQGRGAPAAAARRISPAG